MTSIPLLSPDDVRTLFATDAIYDVEDAAIGEQVEEMQKRGMRIESEDGLDFLKDNVLGDKRVQHFLHALFPRSGLGIYEVFRWNKKHSGLIYSFMTGQLPRSAVVVQLWAPNSKMVCYQGSHLLPIQGFPASIGLLEIPYASLRRCKPVEVDMAKGGLAIFDARLAFEITSGYAIHCVFATWEELKSWPKKIYPNDRILQKKAAEMESIEIGLNFSFTGDTDVQREDPEIIPAQTSKSTG